MDNNTQSPSINRIDQYLEALRQAFESVGETVPWPFHVATIHPYYSDIEAADLYKKFKLLSDQPAPKQVVEGILIRPSVSKSTLLMDLVMGMKVVRPPITREERVWFVMSIFDVLDEMQFGDIFCRNGANLNLSPTLAEKLFLESNWHWANSEPTYAHLARKVWAAALGLNWSLYFYAWPDIGLEIHGPYEINSADGMKLRLLVRDFFDPKPILLWDSVTTFPYRSIRILTLYRGDTDLHIDFFNHLTHSQSLPERTIGVLIEADGLGLNAQEDAEKLLSIILTQLLQQRKLILSMTHEELIRKFIQSRYYALRNWRLYFGEDWRPPSSVFDRVKRWGVLGVPNAGPPSWELLRKAFDPRDDFYFKKES